MPVNLPGASASGDAPAVTLADLREIVAEAERLELGEHDHIVRFTAIPFRTADMFAPGGSVAVSVTLDTWPDDLNPARSWPTS